MTLTVILHNFVNGFYKKIKDKEMETVIAGDISIKKPAQRISALDLARVFAMLMMIQGHAVDALAIPEKIDSTIFPWNIWEFMRGITAPVFLMVSGAVHVFANKRPENGVIPSSKIFRRIRTALALIAIGYLLVFPAEKIYDLFFIEKQYWLTFFQVNVLQLIGVSLLLATIVFWLTNSDKKLFIASVFIAVAITALTPFVFLVTWFDILPEAIAAYFSMEHGSVFTIFPYTAFLFYGIALGTLIKRTDPERRIRALILYGLPMGTIFILAGYWLTNYFTSLHIAYPPGAQPNPGIILSRVGYVFVWLAVTSIIFMKTKRFENVYKMFGKRALLIYVIHLFVVFGTPVFPGFASFYFKSLTITNVIIVTIIVELITLSFTYFVEFTLRKYPQSVYFWKYSITAYLIYLLFI